MPRRFTCCPTISAPASPAPSAAGPGPREGGPRSSCSPWVYWAWAGPPRCGCNVWLVLLEGDVHMIRIDHLDHLVLTVASLDATCDFYVRVLGMAVETFGQGRKALRFGD